MKYLRTVFIMLCCLININAANAQFRNDISGKPILTQTYTDVEGSPYLNDDWQTGTVKFANGKSIIGVKLKYDIVADELYFADKNDEPLSFVDTVKEFTLAGPDKLRYFRKGFAGIAKTTPNSYFEVLADGGVQLIKKTSKVVLETQAFNSATKTKSFQEDVRYYLVNNGKAVQVKNDRKSILAALPNKQEQIKGYADAGKLNFKSDTDLAAIITYYNSQ
ncbi:hypothetical protein FFF34_005135 [Inquilinus sp. KBS0705]|nr:hypothetical protein FFF34_005135 [Inquilinus sp. KBS0705]